MLIIFLVLLTLVVANCDENIKFCHGKNYSTLSTGVNEVFEQIVLKYTKAVNIFKSQHCENPELTAFRDELSKVLCKKSLFVVRQQHFSDFNSQQRRKQSTVLIVDEFNDFLDLYEELWISLIQFDALIVIILVQGRIPQMEMIFKIFWKVQTYKVLVVYENDDNELLLETFMPFNSRSCNNTKPFILNKISNGLFALNPENSFPKALKNLEGCEVRVAISNTTRPFVMTQRLVNGTYVVTGSDIDLIESIADKLNFTINYSYILEEGFFFDNGSMTGPLKQIFEGRADFTLSNWVMKDLYLQFFDASRPYYIDDIVLVVPPGRQYTGLETLFYPLTPSLWALVLLCFTVGIIIIFIIKHHSKEVQNFVFGTGVRHPYLNLFIAAYGGSQNVLPKRNFARFLLMAFLLYSLVIRTIYQASYYQLIKSNARHDEVQSIEKMIKDNFDFYIYAGNADIVSGSSMENRLSCDFLNILSFPHQ